MRKVAEYKDQSNKIFCKLMYDSGRLWFTFKETKGRWGKLIQCITDEEAELEKQRWLRGEISHV